MKFWKKLAVGVSALCMCLALTACGNNDIEISKDLDGNGVISEWETVFENTQSSNRVIQAKDIELISSFSALKAINDRTDETKVYMLSRNIDCGGEEVNIDLGTSVLYGNNKVIKNFKLAKHSYSKGTGDNESEADVNVYGVIFNGVGIYDLKIFMGMQTITLDDTNARTIVSPIINTANVEEMDIKGKIQINRNKPNGLGYGSCVDASLGVSDLKLVEGDINEKNQETLSVRNITVWGEIDYNEEDTFSTVTLGGVMPKVNASSILYNATSHVDISAESSGTIIAGGVCGVNNDLVTNAYCDGKINTTYSNILNDLNMIGGLVGYNALNSEIKDSTSLTEIKFDAEASLNGSKNAEMHIGGTAGRNLGVIDYVNNSASITISNTANGKVLNVGGVCGSSESAIFSNVLNSGKVKIMECSNIYASEFCGISKYGYFEQIVDTAVLDIVNTNISSSVKLGMLTMFEYFDENISNAKYNADYSPYFNGILVAGGVSVTTKSGSNFNYNLGLRNTYEYYVLDENGSPIPETDESGNPIKDADDKEIYVTATRVPDIYNKLYRLDSYLVKKYSVTGENVTADQLKFTYAKDASNGDLISALSQSRLLVSYFIRDLGFKYGLNHNELDLTSDTNEIDLSKLKFTLDTTDDLTRFFEEKHYNGELSQYDKFIDKKCTYDTSDEMFSYLNALILSDTQNLFTPLKVSMDFIKSVQTNVGNEDEDIEDNPNINDNQLEGDILADNFASNVSKLLSKLFGVVPTPKKLAMDQSDITYDSSNLTVKYEQLEVSDSNYRYYFTFDITQIPLSTENNSNNASSFTIYLRYRRASR